MTLDNQIKYRCRRGLLELDLILNNFQEKKLPYLKRNGEKTKGEQLDTAKSSQCFASQIF